MSFSDFNDTKAYVWLKIYIFNTSYLTDSYIAFTLKMESVSQNTIFGQKLIVKSGLDFFFWNPSMREDSHFFYWICDFGHFYEVRESSLPHGGISKRFFLDHFSPSFLGQKWYFWIQIPFWGKTRCMYQSSKMC